MRRGDLHSRLLLAVLISFSAAFVQAQTFTVLHNFNETDGCCSSYPGMMVQGRDGNIYGTTLQGGTYLYGNVFKMTPAGVVTSIHSFDLTHGGYPESGLSLGLDGNFYGATYQGGVNHYGTLFKITPTGTFTEIYDFTNTNDGAYPKAPPVQAQDGNLYGTTGNGTVAVLYKLTTAGVFTVIQTIAAQTYSPLLLGVDGNLYGMTLYGGKYNGGTVFQFSPATKVLKTIFNFDTEYSPTGPLMQGLDGALYGTVSTGGTGDGGAVFRLTTGGVYKVVYNFSVTGTADGRHPTAGVVQGSDKMLYGVTEAGGANGLGTLFKVSITGSGFKNIHDFATATGDTPTSALLLHTNGKIYGQTSHGGTHVSDGVVFSLDAGLKPFVRPVVIHAAKVGGAVQLLGQNFKTATAVLFGSTAATTTVTSNTFMTATPTAGSTTALITVDEPSGNLTTQVNFKIIPTVTSFSPGSGTVGSQVTITGMSFSQATGVKFGGVAATVFTVNSNTKITATVPSGAVSGKISVSTPGGTGLSATSFTVN
jgi:uncharacterized repeat protein (TIGR03803 family)